MDRKKSKLTISGNPKKSIDNIELAKLQAEIKALKKENAELVSSAEEDTLTIQALQNSNEELTNEIAELTKDLKSTKVELINRRAKEAQAFSIRQIKKKQQIRAIKESAKVAQTKSKKRAFYKNASKNLQNFTVGRNTVSSSTIKDGLNREDFDDRDRY